MPRAGAEGTSKEVYGNIATPSSSFTRPADTTSYASGDLVANNTTAGSVTPLSWTAALNSGGSGMIRRAALSKSTATTTAASFRLHLYSQSPTIANGDNAAWSTTKEGYLGSIDLDVSGGNGRAFSNGAGVQGVPGVGGEISFALSSGQTVYGLLEARGSYAPGNGEVFTITLEILQN